jgi:hypothetical protein
MCQLIGNTVVYASRSDLVIQAYNGAHGGGDRDRLGRTPADVAKENKSLASDIIPP